MAAWLRSAACARFSVAPRSTTHLTTTMTVLLPTTLISRAEGLLATEVDGETVLMHVEQGQYFGLARTAHSIWQLLDEPLTFEQLCTALRAKYSGPLDVIASESRRFIEKMAAERLVSLT